MQRTPETSPLFQALKVLGEPNRLQILLHVGLECCPVTDIINATGLPQTNVSFHLRVLREGGFVRAERRGPFVYYCLEDPELLHILHELKEWLEARPLLTAETTSRQNPASKHSAQNRVEEVSS
jgi:DNA-binding transcriptional ArsR family regulator